MPMAGNEVLYVNYKAIGPIMHHFGANGSINDESVWGLNFLGWVLVAEGLGWHSGAKWNAFAREKYVVERSPALCRFC